MAASYPAAIKTFATHQNLTEIIDASHPNDIQAEVVALENAVGTAPAQSTTAVATGWVNNGTLFANLAARVANIEKGVVANAHTQYAQKTGDTLTGSFPSSGATFTSPIIVTPTLSGTGGTLTLPAGPDTLVGRATTDTMTNKTLNAAVLNSASTIGGISGTQIATLAGLLTASTTWSPTLASNWAANYSVIKQIGKFVFVRAQLVYSGGTLNSGTVTAMTTDLGGLTSASLQMIPCNASAGPSQSVVRVNSGALEVVLFTTLTNPIISMNGWIEVT